MFIPNEQEQAFAAMGVKRSKPSPELYSKNLDSYQAAADWVRKRLLDHGFDCGEAQLDPYSETWYFYERNELVLVMSHELMDRVLTCLLATEWHFDYPDKG